MLTGNGEKNMESDRRYDALLGKILYCRKKDGQIFTAKLLEVHGDDMHFQNSRGTILVNKFSDLALISLCGRRHDS